MSGICDADLVRVRSHGELRVGMTVVLHTCPLHRRTCSILILAQERHPTGRHIDEATGRRDPCASPAQWRITDGPRSTCFCGAIEERRLYRLRDLDDAEEEGRRIATDIDDRKRAEQRERQPQTKSA